MFKTYEFLSYLKDEFPGTLDSPFVWDMTENMTDYVASVTEDEEDYKGAFVRDLLQIIPEVTEEEIRRFLN